MKKIKVIMLALITAAVSSYATVYINENYETSTLGTNPVCSYSTPGGSSTNTAATTNTHVWVVDSSVNKAGSGQGVEFDDNDAVLGVRMDYDVLGTNNVGVSALRFDFKFAPLRTDGPGANYINAAVMITNGSSGGSFFRFGTLRLYENGTIRLNAGATAGNSTPYITVSSGTAYRVSFYVNDEIGRAHV